MTSRQRVKVLLNREIPDRMGLCEHFWPETPQDRWPRHRYPSDKQSVDIFDVDLVACESGIKTEKTLRRPEHE